MVGYNRRFSPLVRQIKDAFGDGPMAMTYRINAGAIPADSWIQDPSIGGGRIIGEVGHFVDLLTFLNGSSPVSVYATAMQAPEKLLDTATLSLRFANGSIGTIHYFANGDKHLAKERVEVFANGCSAVLTDFKVLSIHLNGKVRKHHRLNQNKGQQEGVRTFINAILNGNAAPIDVDCLVRTSLATFRSIESIHCGRCLSLLPDAERAA